VSSATSFSRDRAFAVLLGLHGLALMVVFPLGPQESRLWHPGVPGVAALAAAFPLAAVLGGMLARRAPILPISPRTLAAAAFLSTLPSTLSFDYPSLVAARLLAGIATGLSYVAIHRVLPSSASPLVARVSPRLVAFGMPVCLLGSTALDWRFGFLPILLGHLAVFTLTPRASSDASPQPLPLREPAPWSLLATSALAFVTAAYLTILSGFLVFNAGHTEFHIPLVLLATALLGLLAPPLVGRLRARTGPFVFYLVTLAASVLALCGLLALRAPLPAPIAVGAIALFLVVNSTRHLALAGLVSPGVAPDLSASHQLHTQFAHHLGFGLGALAAGQLILLTPRHTFAGMPALLGASLCATGLALFAGLAAHSAQTKVMPNPAEMPSSRMRAPS
jgi:predicted MFS family arabinose efflux permease